MATTVIKLTEVSLDELHEAVLRHRTASMTSYLLHRQHKIDKARAEHCVERYMIEVKVLTKTAENTDKEGNV